MLVVSMGVQGESLQGYFRLRPSAMQIQRTNIVPKIEKPIVKKPQFQQPNFEIEKAKLQPGKFNFTYGNVPPVLTDEETRGRFVAAVSWAYATKNNLEIPQDAKNCFTDTVGHIHERNICWMKQLGFISGFSDGNFHPEDGVNRSEAAKMLVLVFLNGQSHPEANNKQLYGDAELNQWFTGYVNTLALNNKVDIKPYPNASNPDLTKSRYFPSYAQTVARTSYWIQNFAN